MTFHNDFVRLCLSCCFLSFPTDQAISINVHQSPPDLVLLPGESPQFSCSHSISSYDRMYWYKQTKNGVFVALGNLNTVFPNPEADFEKKITMLGDGRNNGTLKILNVSVADNAVYFCAASRHSVADAFSAV
uniref:Ig-like domain-containing protein n=1 Tax=Scleropages formosus TaxID=113540 RepID=A0A8C9R7X9_SCLFO